MEVMVAMTITGLALGALLSVIGGNKRLSWRSEQALLEAAQVRSRINFAQINDGRGEAPMNLPRRELILRDGVQILEPERKTQASNYTLRGFEVLDESGETAATGIYWLELQRPE